MVNPIGSAPAQLTSLQNNVTNPFQQRDDQQNQVNRAPQENRVQPQGAAASGTQEAATNNQNRSQTTNQPPALSAGSEQPADITERGSLLDISV